MIIDFGVLIQYNPEEVSCCFSYDTLSGFVFL